MTTVTVDGNTIRVGSTRVPLLSGEFHYFRHARIWWKAIMDAIKDSGLSVISSYVCWDFHELEPGRYDFVGETSPQRDLVGFLNLCKEQGLHVLLRPGPYLGTEWKNWGIPDHAAVYHRLSPQFLTKARHYLGEALRVVRPHLATNGGPVILVQVDNEVDMNQTIYTPTVGYPCYSPLFWKQIVTEGTPDEPGTFRHWLKEKYGTVGALNLAWGTHLETFDEASPLEGPQVTLGERQQQFDAEEFWETYSTDYLREIARIYREEHIDVPLYTNTYSRPQPMNSVAMQEIVDLVGPDFYCSTPATADEILGMSLGVRLARSTTRLPWSPEFQAGTVPTWVPWRGQITPEHQRYMGLLGMLFGLKGWNWYMLVNRDEWYFSPINEKGEIREQFYKHFRDLVRVFKELEWPDMERCCQTGLLWQRPHFWFASHPVASLVHRLSGQGAPGEGSPPRESKFDQALRGLHDSDIDFEVLDPAGRYLELSSMRMLIYAGFSFVDRATAAALLAYVRGGGSLAIFGSPPANDIHGMPVDSLTEALPPVDGVMEWGGPLRFRHEGISCVATSRLVYTYNLAQHPEAVPIQGLGTTIGYRLNYGEGRVLVVGLDASRESIGFVHDTLGIPVPSQSDVVGVLTSAWAGPQGVALVVVNTKPDNTNVAIALDIKALGIEDERHYLVKELLGGEEEERPGHTLATVSVSLKGRDGLIYSIRPV